MQGLRNFLVHLRLHYQLFILSGPYLCGGLLAPTIDWREFLLQFFNVHVLLFGGATAYNSFVDKDEGPIGGLKNPPKMQPWMHPASIILQLIGVAIATRAGGAFTAAYLLSALCFWLYSSPLARWKGRPYLSFIAIGVSSGSTALLMGRLAADPFTPLGWWDWSGALGAAAMLLSLYPVSQLYQMEEDARRADRTFAITFGLSGIRRSFQLLFRVALVTLILALAPTKPWWMAVALGIAAPGIGIVLWKKLQALRGMPSEYEPIMRLKYGTSLAFVAIIAGALVLERL